jgi:membrane fusion protein (multidrug efflux system)
MLNTASSPILQGEPTLTQHPKAKPPHDPSARKHVGSARSSPLQNLLKGLVVPFIALLAVIGLVGYSATHWTRWVGLAATQTTDDAQIRADTSRLAARVAGTIRFVAVGDFQRVRAGDLLVEIDPADYQVAVAQATANVAAAEATYANLDNQFGLQRAIIMQAEAEWASMAAKELEARQERERQQSLLPTGTGTRQRVERAVAAHVTAQSSLRSAEAAIVAQNRQLDLLFGTQKQRAAEVAAARSALDAAELRLGYTRVVAPFDGVVGERQVQVGNYVSAGTSLISLVPLPRVHVIANYKEIQLSNVVPGQPAEITVDGLPGTTFHGYVEQLSPASGSQFALLPPDNATGNFTKVVQRIPVRIVLDPAQPLLDRLRPGMSVISHIQTDGGSAREAAPR